MEEKPEKEKSVLVKDVKIKGKESMLWMQRVEFSLPKEEETENYYSIVVAPICTDSTDEYKYEMGEELEKRGYETGMGSMIYKEGLSLEELVECLVFHEAYRTIYDSFYEGGVDDHYYGCRDIPLKITEFLKRVDEEIKKVKEEWKEMKSIAQISSKMFDLGFKPSLG